MCIKLRKSISFLNVGLPIIICHIMEQRSMPDIWVNWFLLPVGNASPWCWLLWCDWELEGPDVWTQRKIFVIEYMYEKVKTILVHLFHWEVYELHQHLVFWFCIWFYLYSVDTEKSRYKIPDDGKSGLPHQVSGLYFGWAKVDIYKIFKVVVGIGRDHCPFTAKWNFVSNQLLYFI